MDTSKLLEWLFRIQPGQTAGGESWRVDFIAEYSNYVKLGLLLVLAGLAFLVIRSYRREGDASRRAKGFLAGVRLAVIVLAMLMLLRPAAILRFSKTLRSTVVVLVDDSFSMSFKDAYAGEDSGPKLARFLGISPDKLADMSRQEIIRRLLARQGGPLAKLAQDHPLMLLRYSSQDTSQPYTRLLSLLDYGEAGPAGQEQVVAQVNSALSVLSGAGHETNIAAALRDALEKVQGRWVAGVVLVSDGQITSEDGSARLASALTFASQRGVNLYSVVVGDPTVPRNVGVSSLQAPQEVVQGSTVEFSALLSHRNFGGRSVKVRLLQRPIDKEQWTDTGVSADVKLEQDEGGGADEVRSRGLQTVKLACEVRQTGQFVYRAQVEAAEDDRLAEDNYADTRLEVSEERVNILLVSSDAGWEFQYLRNFLLRQGELYRVSIWQQSADAEVNQAASSEKFKLAELPKTLAELMKYRVVILYDPEPTVGSGGKSGGMVTLASLLKDFVTRHEGGLCYIAGNKYSDSLLPGKSSMPELVELLPVILRPNTLDLGERISEQTPPSWPLRLTTYGREHPSLRLAPKAEDNANLWQALPGVFWTHPVERVKPAARVLATSSNPQRRTARGEPEPVIVTQPVGGRVLYIGSDETWRWRYLNDGQLHRRFWENSIRYLASLKARRVIITAGGDRFDVGEKITVEAQAYDEEFRPLTAETFKVRMVAVQTAESRPADRELELKADPKSGGYKLTIRADQTGTYELTALDGDPQKVASKRIVIDNPRAEARRSEASPATLQTFATRPEFCLRAYEVDRLAELIPAGRLKAAEEKTWELWDSPLTLVLILTLLGVEWILRKKYNMA
ncbi:MAG: hypothetical protein BWX88_00738 [Planctomycetes bacterium ADurb.Bin126]|nr:MAG: hypothetical protein BWX88_00738 [Planctomycetes bacterium ADurb.Bin126]HOD83542.1 VWA domain-containing protein [Phycisphaerae bacterium]HQL73448.1 VWA domain-containing protein [Phycisphaerae bacterium]